MWLIWIGLALVILKVLELGPFAAISWWWIALLGAIGFVWFEFIERLLGLDKKKAFDEIDKHKKLRIQRALEADKARRRR